MSYLTGGRRRRLSAENVVLAALIVVAGVAFAVWLVWLALVVVIVTA